MTSAITSFTEAETNREDESSNIESSNISSSMPTTHYPATTEEHNEMDETVLKYMADVIDSGPDLPRITAGLLLSYVAETAPKLNHAYNDAKYAIKEVKKNDCLYEELLGAWRQKSFKSIRDLEDLHAPQAIYPAHRSDFRIEDEDEATKASWSMAFSGNSHTLLEHAIHDMNATRGKNPYANFLPIIQSSGMGKSRTVDELAKSVFTLPFNLRPDEEASGYPLADGQVRDMFRPGPSESRTDLRHHYVWFLNILFQEVQHYVQTLPKQQSHDKLALLWRQKLLDEGFREQLYWKVVKTAEIRPDGIEDSNVTAAQAQAQALLETIYEWSGRTHRTGGSPVDLVIYFDESHVLTSAIVSDPPSPPSSRILPGQTQLPRDSPVGDKSRSAYQTLCWALNNLYRQPIITIFLSTNSNLGTFSPSGPYFWSNRERNAPITTLQAPFVELSFDISHDRSGVLVKEDTMTLDDVCSDKFMVRFGRPLFWTRYESGTILVQQDIINFAIAKLTCDKVLDPPNPPSNYAGLAACGVRLLLEFEPRRDAARQAENRLVSGHMRVAYSVPAHREYMRSGSPSEPILAEAAARVMESMHDIPHHLLAFIQNGLVSKGELGELVARLLTILAHDSAARNLAFTLKIHPVRYSTPIPLSMFLGELVGAANLKTIMKSQPDNLPAGVTFETAFKNAMVHFTHWVKAGDSSILSDDAAWKAMARGMAYQCFDRQPQIDLAIPLLLHKEHKLCRPVMSWLLFQIKNKAKKQPIHIVAEQLGCFSRGAEDRRPYITIAMELGVQPRQQCSGAKVLPKKAQLQRAATTSKLVVKKPGIAGSKPRMAKKYKALHPRYAISITGCSSTVYPIIGNRKDEYAQLLGSRSFLDEHPRQDKQFLDAVRQLKPMWTQEESFHWASSTPDTVTGPDLDLPSETEEGVVARQFNPEDFTGSEDDEGEELSSEIEVEKDEDEPMPLVGE